MTDNKACGACEKLPKIQEAVCIDTHRVYDSCADKDCLADLRVYFSPAQQEIVDRAAHVRAKGVEILTVTMDVEKMPFNRGCYSVDSTFFFKVTVEVFSAALPEPAVLTGLAVFSKKCILYGSDGNVHIYSSEYLQDGDDKQVLPSNTNPRAKMQMADPICLSAKLCRPCDCCGGFSETCTAIPKKVRSALPQDYPDNMCSCACGNKVVAVTIGLFTIVQLERDVQMLIPAYDFCMPKKECSCDTDDPCEAFRKIQFPVDAFFPPQEKNCPTCNTCGPFDPKPTC